MNIDYTLTSCYTSRKLTSTIQPTHKLHAFCINLQNRIHNMNFIHNEWKDYLHIIRFIALSSATKSHIAILKYIYLHKKNIQFPIVIMEDDVYRKNDFTKYWNQLLDIKNCDYIALDAFYLKFKKSQKNVPKDFVSLEQHRAMGFTIYYKHFFDRFSTIQDLMKVFQYGNIDMKLTHNPLFINYTPKEQICCQIVSKYSTTAKKNTNYYKNHYILAEKKLLYTCRKKITRL